MVQERERERASTSHAARARAATAAATWPSSFGSGCRSRTSSIAPTSVISAAASRMPARALVVGQEQHARHERAGEDRQAAEQRRRVLREPALLDLVDGADATARSAPTSGVRSAATANATSPAKTALVSIASRKDRREATTVLVSASSTSRTFSVKARSVNGFSRNAACADSSPWRCDGLVGVAGHEQHAHARARCAASRSASARPLTLGHHDVGQQQVDARRGAHAGGLGGVGDGEHAVAVGLEHQPHEVAHAGVVLDDHDRLAAALGVAVVGLDARRARRRRGPAGRS